MNIVFYIAGLYQARSQSCLKSRIASADAPQCWVVHASSALFYIATLLLTSYTAGLVCISCCVRS